MDDILWVDLEHGSSILGSKDVAIDLLVIFTKKLTQEIDIIRKHRQDKQWRKFYEAIHKLHGAACYSSTPKIKHTLQTIEHICRKPVIQEETAPCHSDVNKIDHALKQLDVDAQQTKKYALKLVSSE